MARVPTKDQPSVQQAGAPDLFSRVQATGADFGAIEGAALEQAGKAVVQAAQSAQDFVNRQNETDFKAAKVNYDTQVNGVLYGDGKKNKGFFSTKSKNAMDAGPVALQRIQEIKDSVMEGHNDEVQASLELSLTAAGDRSTANMSRHVTSQRNIYDQQLDDAQIKQTIDDASRDYDNPETVNNSVSMARLLALRSAKRNGAPPEIIDDLMNDAATAVLSGTVQAAINNGDIAAAQKLMTDHKAEMNAGTAAQLTKMLSKSTELAKAQENSDEIFSKEGTTPDERMAMARKVKNPQEREATVIHVQRRNTELAQTQKRLTKEAQGSASLYITSNQGPLSDWGALNPEELELIQQDPETWNRLKALDKARSKGLNNAEVSDGKTLRLLLKKTPREVAAMSEDEQNSWDPLLTARESIVWAGKIRGAKAAAEATKETAAPFKRIRQIAVQQAPEAFGFRNPRPTTEEVARRNTFDHNANEFVASFTDRNKIPTDAEMLTFVQRQFTVFTRVEEGFFFDSDIELIGAGLKTLPVAERQQFKVDLEQLPQIVKDRVAKEINNVGVEGTPSDEMIGSIIKARLLGSRVTIPFQFLSETSVTVATQAFNDAGIQPTELQIGQLVGAELVGDVLRGRELLRKPTAPRPTETPLGPRAVEEEISPDPFRGIAPPGSQLEEESEEEEDLIENIPAPRVPSLTRVFDAVAFAESNRNPKAKGGKGEVGTMQVLPSTLKDPGFDIKPAKNNSDAERTRVGQEFLGAMLTKYDDNLDHALAAYNWGPANVDKWIKRGARLNKLPKSTQAYIKKIRKEMTRN